MTRHDLFAWVTGATLIVAASCSTSPAPSSPASPPPIVVNAATACTTIGAEGGSVAHPSGAKLSVPAGALDGATSLCLAGIAPPSDQALGGAALNTISRISIQAC